MKFGLTYWANIGEFVLHDKKLQVTENRMQQCCGGNIVPIPYC